MSTKVTTTVREVAYDDEGRVSKETVTVTESDTAPPLFDWSKDRVSRVPGMPEYLAYWNPATALRSVSPLSKTRGNGS